MRIVSDRFVEGSPYIFLVLYRLSENYAVFEINSKTLVWPERPETAIQYISRA
jgi:hypothetical protein